MPLQVSVPPEDGFTKSPKVKEYPKVAWNDSSLLAGKTEARVIDVYTQGGIPIPNVTVVSYENNVAVDHDVTNVYGRAVVAAPTAGIGYDPYIDIKLDLPNELISFPPKLSVKGGTPRAFGEPFVAFIKDRARLKGDPRTEYSDFFSVSKKDAIPQAPVILPPPAAPAPLPNVVIPTAPRGPVRSPADPVIAPPTSTPAPGSGGPALKVPDDKKANPLPYILVGVLVIGAIVFYLRTKKN
jgi:hypothetical protein